MDRRSFLARLGMLTAAAAVMDPEELIDHLAPRRLYVPGADFALPYRTAPDYWDHAWRVGDSGVLVSGGVSNAFVTVVSVSPLTLEFNQRIQPLSAGDYLFRASRKVKSPVWSPSEREMKRLRL